MRAFQAQTIAFATCLLLCGTCECLAGGDVDTVPIVVEASVGRQLVPIGELSSATGLDAGPVEISFEGNQALRSLALRIVSRVPGGGYEEVTGYAKTRPWLLEIGTGLACGDLEARGVATVIQAGRPVAEIPLNLQVRGSRLRRWGAGFLWALVMLVVAVILWMPSRLVVCSRFLPAAETIAGRLEPVRDGKRPVGARIGQDLTSTFQQALRPGKRLSAYLRSNPLRLLLPGRLYQETLTLSLGRGASFADVVAMPGLVGRLRAEPEAYTGRLFVIASRDGSWRGAAMAAVPDESGCVEPGVKVDARGQARSVRPRLVWLGPGATLQPRGIGEETYETGWKLAW